MSTVTVHLTPTERRFLTALAAGQRVVIGTTRGGRTVPLARTVAAFGAKAGITLRVALALHRRGLIDASQRFQWSMATGVEITAAGRAAIA